jgi:catechol 2,3-dioxygenase-like lactoylglutathione lyase family enzyme
LLIAVLRHNDAVQQRTRRRAIAARTTQLSLARLTLLEGVFSADLSTSIRSCVSLLNDHRTLNQSIAHVALVVRDYDEAIAFFTEKLLFTLVEDTYMPDQDKRWVTVAPRGSTGTSLVLARPSHEGQVPFIGNQTGGRVTFFLQTDDFWRDYGRMKDSGIEFVRDPANAPYGTVAVFKDLYGNLWDLVGRSQAHGREASA